MDSSLAMELEDRSRLGGAPQYTVPSSKFVNVEHPCIINNSQRAVETLGGEAPLIASLGEAGSKSNSNPLRLNLRPQDPFSRSIESRVVSANGLLIQIDSPRRTGRKRKRGSKDQYELHDEDMKKKDKLALRAIQDNPESCRMSVIGEITSVHRFRSPPDFVTATSTSPFLANFKKTILSGSYDKICEFTLRDNGAPFELVRPPVLAPTLSSFPYSYQQNTNAKTKQGQRGKNAAQAVDASKGRVISISFDAKTVPESNTEDLVTGLQTLSKSDQEMVTLMQKQFERRPIWTRRALRNAIRAEDTNRSYIENHLYAYVAYMFSSGAWRDALVRFGVDPRNDPSMRVYQTMFFRMDDIGPDRRTAQSSNQRSSSQIRGGQALRHPNCPEPPLNQGHIFDGTSIDTSGKVWQVIDITDPLVSVIRDQAQVCDACDAKQSGWYPEGTWAKMRAVTKVKIRHLMEKGEPAGSEAAGPLQKILQVDDTTIDFRSPVREMSLDHLATAVTAASNRNQSDAPSAEVSTKEQEQEQDEDEDEDEEQEEDGEEDEDVGDDKDEDEDEDEEGSDEDDNSVGAESEMNEADQESD